MKWVLKRWYINQPTKLNLKLNLKYISPSNGSVCSFTRGFLLLFLATVEVNQGLLELATEVCTRGHEYKLSKPRAISLPRFQFFSVRTINKWNSLPVSMVSPGNINSFKSRLDSHWRDQQCYSTSQFFYPISSAHTSKAQVNVMIRSYRLNKPQNFCVLIR